MKFKIVLDIPKGATWAEVMDTIDHGLLPADRTLKADKILSGTFRTTRHGIHGVADFEPDAVVLTSLEQRVVEYVEHIWEGGEGYYPSRVEVIGSIGREVQIRDGAKRPMYAPIERAVDRVLQLGLVRHVDDPSGYTGAGGDLAPGHRD